MIFNEYIKLVSSYMEKSESVIDKLYNILDKSIQLSNTLSTALKHEYEIKTKMKSLLERLAPEDGINIVDDDGTYCAFCWLEKELKKIKAEHAPDCPWVEARKLLEELK
jgi:hypothetical protein